MVPSADPDRSKECEDTRCVMIEGAGDCRTSWPITLFTKSSSGTAVDTAIFGEALIEFEKVVTVWRDLIVTFVQKSQGTSSPRTYELG